MIVQEGLVSLRRLSRADKRDLPLEAVFLCNTPFRTARSKKLSACTTAVSASATSPTSMERKALLIPVRVALRALRLRWERFIIWRAAFFAGNSFLLNIIP